jgi:hypothetical protein
MPLIFGSKRADFLNKKKGGKREGAGRKPSPPALLKVPISIKLPRWLVEWMDEQQKSRAVLIEDALQEQHKIGPPNVK